MNIDFKSIPLDGTCKNKGITLRKRYLVKIDGEWFIGRFSREWYGLNFEDWGGNGIQLDGIDKVYEVGRLP